MIVEDILKNISSPFHWLVTPVDIILQVAYFGTFPINKSSELVTLFYYIFGMLVF